MASNRRMDMDEIYSVIFTIKSRAEDLMFADQAFRRDPNRENAERIKEILAGPLLTMHVETRVMPSAKAS